MDAEEGKNNFETNVIDYTMSLHTKSLQSSNYIKINDNLLGFKMDRYEQSKKPALSDYEVKALKDELNKIHIKYLSKE